MELTSDEQLGRMIQHIGPLYFHDVAKAAPVAAVLSSGPPAVAAFHATSASNERFLVHDRLEEIQVPTLVLVGRHDFICSPVQAQMLADGILAAQLHVFEKSGHFPWIEEPEAFFTTIRQFFDA